MPPADDVPAAVSYGTGLLTVISALAARKWTQRAACLDSDRRFVLEPASERHSPTTILGCLQVCAGCPVRRECLDDALNEDQTEVVGIWGGTTTLERREARDLLGDRGRNAEEWQYRSKSDYRLVLELLMDTFDARLARWVEASNAHRQNLDPSMAPRYLKQKPLPPRA